MQAVMETLDRNTKIDFGAEMKHKHFILLHMRLLFFVSHYKNYDYTYK